MAVKASSGGVYHSRYDTYEHHSRFVDPGFVYDALLAKTVGRIVMRVANSDLPVQRAGDFADTVALYLAEVKKLATDKREAQIRRRDCSRIASSRSRPIPRSRAARRRRSSRFRRWISRRWMRPSTS